MLWFYILNSRERLVSLGLISPWCNDSFEVCVIDNEYSIADDKPKPPTTDAVASQDGQASEDDQHNSWRRSTRNNQQDKSK